jgi:hypothetical protein
MKFLDHTWIWDWCRENGFPLDEPEGPVAPRLADDPTLIHRERPLHAVAGKPDEARVLAEKLAHALGKWDECLIWVSDWDIWPNEEDWPRYYAWRGAFGERRSLRVAPGHVLEAGDAVALRDVLAHILECGWDATLLPAEHQRSTGLRIRTSHDEWIELQSTVPVGFTVVEQPR